MAVALWSSRVTFFLRFRVGFLYCASELLKFMKLNIGIIRLYIYICVRVFCVCVGEREREGGVKAIPVTRRRGLHFVDNRLTDGGVVVSPMRRPPFSPDSWYSFLLEAESTPGP
jgi:hypothetical protein